MESQKTIGIVGGGQLGRMLTLAALPLGFKVVVVNPLPDSPAKQVGAQEIVGDLYDEAVLQELADRADFITIEIEHLNADALARIAKTSGVPINTTPATIKLIQDKFKQKEFLAKHGVQMAPFVEISDEESANAALKKFKGRMLIKARHGAYDGRGNMVVRSSVDVHRALEHFAGKQLYAEGFVPFVKELAVLVARSTTGEIKTYPVVETIHERNICLEVLAPAPVEAAIRKKAENLATKVAKLLDGAGIYGIEMFLTSDGRVLLNEIAPRVHNSGHFTMDGARTSQFEQHIRAISGLPLGDTSLSTPAVVMINILGEDNHPTNVTGLHEALAIPGTYVHLYGKSPTKVDRKMGHINATGSTISQARSRARKARRVLDI